MLNNELDVSNDDQNSVIGGINVIENYFRMSDQGNFMDPMSSEDFIPLPKQEDQTPNFAESTPLTLERKTNLSSSDRHSDTPLISQQNIISSQTHESTSDMSESEPEQIESSKSAEMSEFDKSSETEVHSIYNSKQNTKKHKHCHAKHKNKKKHSRKNLIEVKEKSSKNNARKSQRKSYFCKKCKAHGQDASVKRHKRKCPYQNCQCSRCCLVDYSRSIVAKQISLYRYYLADSGLLVLY